MKYDFETKLKAVLSKKAGHLIDEPYGEINRHWRDEVLEGKSIQQTSIDNNIETAAIFKKEPRTEIKVKIIDELRPRFRLKVLSKVANIKCKF